jgi:hypothetical protein
MSKKTESGFPIGKVAQTLRKILDPKLTEHQVEAIVVLLMLHLQIERGINGVLYRWLRRDAPSPPAKRQKVSQAENKLWDVITDMSFHNKLSLLRPFFGIDFEREANNVAQINNLRNTVFHRRDIDKAKFGGKSLAEEPMVDRIFHAAQEAIMNLNKFDEMLDAPHAYAERDAKELADLKRDLMKSKK